MKVYLPVYIFNKHISQHVRTSSTYLIENVILDRTDFMLGGLSMDKTRIDESVL